MIEAAVALDAPLLMHPANPPGRDRRGDYELTVVADYMFENTFSVFHIVCSGFLYCGPTLTLTLTLLILYAGGFAATLRARMQREVDTNPDIVLRAPMGDYLRCLWFDTFCFESNVLALVAKIAGMDRLVLDSDAPFPLGEPVLVGF